MTFNEVYKIYSLFVTRQQKKQSLDTINYNFNKHIIPLFNGKNINSLTNDDFIKWYDYILSCNFSNNYNRNLYFEFTNFLDYCIKNNYLKTNYLRELGSFKKKVEVRHTDFYTIKEFKKFIRGFDNIIYKTYFKLLFYTGLRPSEAMALKFSDFKGFFISVNKNIHRKGKRLLDTPKNSSSIRTIKIDIFLYYDLLKLKKYYIKNNLDYSDDYFIFGYKKPLSPTTIDRYKLKACKKMNIRPITQHQFRHSHATLLLHYKILINEVSRRLGHSKTSTTLDIYAHTNSTQEKRVIKTLNSLKFHI